MHCSNGKIPVRTVRHLVVGFTDLTETRLTAHAALIKQLTKLSESLSLRRTMALNVQNSVSAEQALFPSVALSTFFFLSYSGISPTVKKTEMDSPSPQESSPRLSFTQHHRPVISVHSGEETHMHVHLCSLIMGLTTHTHTHSGVVEVVMDG